jgi:bacterial/archaeal transporter family-2 protein
MHWLLTLFAILAGISNPLQSGSNSALLKSTQAPVVAAFVVYLIGSVCLLACIPFLGFPLRSTAGKLADVPWWAYIGGLCNALFLMCTLLVTKKASFEVRVGALPGQVRAQARRSEHLTRVG